MVRAAGYIACVAAVVVAAALSVAGLSIGVALLAGLMLGFLTYVVLNAPRRYRRFSTGQIQQAQDNLAGIFGNTYPEDREGLDGDASRQVGRTEPCPCGSGRKYKYCHEKQTAS